MDMIVLVINNGERERERERERLGAYNDDQANNFTSIFPEIYMLHVNMIQYRIY